MFESIWMMLGASNWWRRLTGSLSAVANWVGQSPFHVVLTGLLIAVALNLWQWHDRDAISARDARQIAQWRSASTAEQGAFRAEQQASGTLRAALARQNVSIGDLTRASATRQVRARAALAAASRRDAGLSALSAKFRRAADSQPPAPLHGTDCRTPEAVMAARDVL